MSFGFRSSGSSGLLSPSFGGLGLGVLDGTSERELTLPSNVLPPSPRNTDPEPTALRNRALYQSVEPEPLTEDPTENESEVRDLGDVQKNFVKAFVEAVFVGSFLKRRTNPSLAPVIADLHTLREEEAEEEFPITPFAIRTALNVLNAAFNDIDASVPMPAIAPDGSGGIRIEWARDNRNVRAVIPSRADQRSFVYHIVNDASKLDRLSGANLAARLREVIL